MNEALQAEHPPRSAAWRTAIIIMVISAIAAADRFAIAIQLGAIKKEFGIGDFQASLLIGAAFTSFYILFLLPIGWAADRFLRRKVLAMCLVVWSLATVACGWASGFVMLFIFRMLVGAGEAGMAPTVHGIIGDSFSRQSLARPLAMQGMGFQAGSAIGVATAGAVIAAAAAGAFKAWPIVGEMSGWRIAFIAVGLPGVIALLLIPLMHDPRELQRREKATLEPIKPFLRANAGLVTMTLLFSGIAAMAIGCVTGWVPEYLQRTYDVSPKVTGASLGGLLLLGAIVGQGLYAIITDWCSARGMKDAPLVVGLLPLALAIPAIWMAFSSGDAKGFLFWLAPLLLCIMPINAIANTMLQTISPAPMRSRMTALNVLTISLLGFTLGPAIVGWLSQYVLGEARLGDAIMVVMLASMLGALTIMMLLRPRLRALQE